MDFISAGIVFLVFVVLVVFTVLSAKTWHWLNIVMINLIFLTTVAATIGLSQAYKLRQRDLTAEQNALAQLERAKKEADLAVFGQPDSLIYAPDSLRAKTQQVRLMFTGRGRVWTGGTATIEQDNPQQRRFTFAVNRPEQQDDLELSRIQMVDTELFLFADENIFGQSYPTRFIGRVLVVSESPTDIVIESVKTGGQELIIEPEEWANPTTSWTLFEKMPIDRHDIFKMRFLVDVEMDPESATPDDQQLAEAIRQDQMEIGPYRRLLEQRYLRPETFDLESDSAEYEAIIDYYAFDGFSLGKIETWIEQNTGIRQSPSFVPNTDEVFVMYRFNQASQDEYIVDSATGALTTDGAFTAIGFAVDRSLHHGGPIRFNEGDFVLIDQQTADGERGADQITPFRLREDVTEIDRVYVRKLRNYPFLFTNLSLRASQAERERARVTDRIQIDETALENAQNQERERERIVQGLEQDIENLKKDLEIVTALAQRRQSELETMQSEIDSLQSRIRETYIRIQELNLEIERSAFAGR